MFQVDAIALKGERANSMLVKMDPQKFNSLEDSSLVWTCIEPTILQIRGKSFLIKSAYSSRLTGGQRALLMFQVLYGHTVNGVMEFYSHLSYLLSNRGVWSELKKGMEYFGLDSMTGIVDQMKDIYQTIQGTDGNENPQWIDITGMEKDSELVIATEKLNERLFELFPEAIRLVGLYIRNHPNEFVQLQ